MNLRLFDFTKAQEILLMKFIRETVDTEELFKVQLTVDQGHYNWPKKVQRAYIDRRNVLLNEYYDKVDKIIEGAEKDET